MCSPGLAVVTPGALRAVAMTPSFSFLTGSDPSFTVQIAGNSYAVQASSGDPLAWVTSSVAVFSQTGLFAFDVNGTNLVSSVTFSGTFTVDSPIKLPVSTVNVSRIKTNGEPWL